VRSLEPTKKNLERFFSKTGEKDWSALTDRSIKEVVTQAISWSGADIGDDDREGFLSANRRSLWSTSIVMP